MKYSTCSDSNDNTKTITFICGLWLRKTIVQFYVLKWNNNNNETVIKLFYTFLFWLGLIIEMDPLAVFKTAKWFNYDDVQFFYYFYKQRILVTNTNHRLTYLKNFQNLIFFRFLCNVLLLQNYYRGIKIQRNRQVVLTVWW